MTSHWGWNSMIHDSVPKNRNTTALKIMFPFEEYGFAELNLVNYWLLSYDCTLSAEQLIVKQILYCIDVDRGVKISKIMDSQHYPLSIYKKLWDSTNVPLQTGNYCFLFEEEREETLIVQKMSVFDGVWSFSVLRRFSLTPHLELSTKLWVCNAVFPFPRGVLFTRNRRNEEEIRSFKCCELKTVQCDRWGGDAGKYSYSPQSAPLHITKGHAQITQHAALFYSGDYRVIWLRPVTHPVRGITLWLGWLCSLHSLVRSSSFPPAVQTLHRGAGFPKTALFLLVKTHASELQRWKMQSHSTASFNTSKVPSKFDYEAKLINAKSFSILKSTPFSLRGKTHY